MSGPKIDEIILLREKQRALEALRQARLEEIKKATDELNREYKAIRDRIAEVKSQCKNILDSVSGFNDDMNNELVAIQGCCKEYIDIMQVILNKGIPAEANDIRTQADEAKKDEQEAYDHYTKTTQEPIRLINIFLEQRQGTEKILEVQFAHGAGEGAHIEDYNFIKCADAAKSQAEEQYKAQIDEMFEEFAALVNNDSVSLENKGKLLAFANNLQQLLQQRGFSEADLTQGKDLIFKIKADAKEFDEAYEDYRAEYIGFLEIIKSFSNAEIPVLPKEPCRFNNLADLQKERENIKNLSVSANERRYIRSQIDEVMQEVGYNTTDELILRAEQSGTHFVCESQDPNSDTAIHVYMSEDNQIMMEVAPLTVRPQENETYVNGEIMGCDSISEEGCAKLLHEQGCFCTLHPQIVKMLKDRGVVLNVIKHNGPEKKYAKTIVKYDADNLLRADRFIDMFGAIINITAEDDERVIGGNNNLRERRMNNT